MLRFLHYIVFCFFKLPHGYLRRWCGSYLKNIKSEHSYPFFVMKHVVKKTTLCKGKIVSCTVTKWTHVKDFIWLIIVRTSKTLNWLQGEFKEHLPYIRQQEFWGESVNKYSQLHSTRQNSYEFLWIGIICITVNFLYARVLKVAPKQGKT